jgi:acyl-lipid omega-6 desaturase (Delta-12 desaturase)
MTNISETHTEAVPTANWKEMVRKYQTPSLPRGLWQIVNSVGAYIAVWVLLYFTLSISYWLSAGLAVLAGGLMVRMFIIFHDCGHGSFFGSKRANDIVGFLTGVLTFTPYRLWRKEHALHHGTAADLDERGVGDMPTMTVEEYLAAPRRTRLGYRIVRNPLVLFVLGPLAIFLIKHRLPLSPNVSEEDRRAVHWTNLALLVMVVGMSLIFGLLPYLLTQLLILTVATTCGTWLFYVQHQFEDVYWERSEKWDFVDAALKGSSFYKLPRVLQWFSGNIGYHHIHHLSPRIPNYHLERCHNAEPLFNAVPAVTLLSSWKTLSYRLWNEREQRMVGFGNLRPRGGTA